MRDCRVDWPARRRFMYSDFMWRWGWVGFVLMVLGLATLMAFLLGG
jgi:hypothetical protein